MLSQNFIDEMKQKLLASKQQLLEELQGLPEHTEMGDDREANADEVNPDEVNAGVRARIEGDLQKIENALARIENGTYGIDEEGVEISEDRLRVLPWADTAI